MMKVVFDSNGGAHVGAGEGFENGYALPEGASTVAARYSLVDGVVTDLFAGMTDDEALGEIERRAAEARAAAVAGLVAASELLPISKLQFMSLFTDAELAGVYQAARSNVMVEVWLEKLKLAETVSLADARTQAGIDSLVAAGLLEAARGEAIKAGEAPA